MSIVEVVGKIEIMSFTDLLFFHQIVHVLFCLISSGIANIFACEIFWGIFCIVVCVLVVVFCVLGFIFFSPSMKKSSWDNRRLVKVSFFIPVLTCFALVCSAEQLLFLIFKGMHSIQNRYELFLWGTEVFCADFYCIYSCFPLTSLNDIKRNNMYCISKDCFFKKQKQKQNQKLLSMDSSRIG